jgi:hypothetical protein
MPLLHTLTLAAIFFAQQSNPSVAPKHSASLAIHFDKTSFKPGDTLNIQLTLTNTGTEPFYVLKYMGFVCSSGSIGTYGVEVKRDGERFGNTYRCASDPFYPIGWVPPTDAELAAKNTIVLLGPGEFIGSTVRTSWSELLGFFPGRYTVRARYEPIPIPKRSMGKILAQEIISSEVEIEVVPE